MEANGKVFYYLLSSSLFRERERERNKQRERERERDASCFESETRSTPYTNICDRSTFRMTSSWAINYTVTSWEQNI